MRGNTPIRTGGHNDPVAQNIRNEQMRDAAPHPDEIKAEQEREQQIAERLSALADDNVYLKNRDAVSDEATERDWSDVANAAETASESRWSFLIKQALTYRDNQ